MIITKADKSDISSILKIVEDARTYLGSKGIDQWQGPYPNEESFLEDIKNDRLYVVKDKDKVIAVFAVVDYERTYDVIYEGQWMDDSPYIAIHRIAVDKDHKGKGVAGFIYDEMKKEHRHIRIDTHPDNLSMRRSLEKNGFKYCGIIYLEHEQSFPLRVAYEYIDI